MTDTASAALLRKYLDEAYRLVDWLYQDRRETDVRDIAHKALKQIKEAMLLASLPAPAATTYTRDEIVSQLETLRRPHLVLEDDCWFSCPKSGECLDDGQPPDLCTCGADAHNARLDAVIAALAPLPAPAAPEEQCGKGDGPQPCSYPAGHIGAHKG